MLEKISYEQVTSTAQSIKSSANNMQQILNNVTQKMNQVGNDDVWKSSAAQQLLMRFKELSSKFEIFYTEIDNYSKFLLRTVETYKAADAAIANKADELFQ